MKKKLIILSIILLIVIVPITINKKYKKENKSYIIETYIDGKLAASLPSSGSGYILDSITCTNGAEGNFNYSTWRVEVSNITDNTKCTVKFKTNNNSFANYLTSNKTSLKLVEENGLRYEGASVNNYVLFNDELWRVIGVFEVEAENKGTQNLVKLIRAEVLDGLAWNKDNVNTWETASLRQSLNNGYLNVKDEECYTLESRTKICKFSETGIKDGAREKIEAVRWNVEKADYKATAGTVYSSEIETKTANYYKVGLMSASDYGYSVSETTCTRTTSLSSYNTSTCAGQSWLKRGFGEWTLTPVLGELSRVLYIGNDGAVWGGNLGVYSVRPSVYLKSTVQYVSGSGTYSDPFIIA